MKKFVKPAAFAVAIILLSFTQPAKAAVGPHLWYSSLGKHTASSGSKFSIELNRRGVEDVMGGGGVEEPVAVEEFALELAGSPAGVTEAEVDEGTVFGEMALTARDPLTAWACRRHIRGVRISDSKTAALDQRMAGNPETLLA